MPHQLHRNGQGDWGSSELPTHKGSADKSCLKTSEKGIEIKIVIPRLCVAYARIR